MFSDFQILNCRDHKNSSVLWKLTNRNPILQKSGFWMFSDFRLLEDRISIVQFSKGLAIDMVLTMQNLYNLSRFQMFFFTKCLYRFQIVWFLDFRQYFVWIIPPSFQDQINTIKLPFYYYYFTKLCLFMNDPLKHFVCSCKRDRSEYFLEGLGVFPHQHNSFTFSIIFFFPSNVFISSDDTSYPQTSISTRNTGFRKPYFLKGPFLTRLVWNKIHFLAGRLKD